MKCFTGNSWNRAQNAENFSAAFASPIQSGNMFIYIHTYDILHNIYVHINTCIHIYTYTYIYKCWYASVAPVLYTLGFFKSSFLQTPSSFFWNPKKNFTPWRQERSKGRTNSSYHICRSQCSSSYRRRKDLLESTEAFRVWNLGGQNFSFFQLE